MICLVIALQVEARPFIQAFKLQRFSAARGFPVYSNKDNTIHLVVSGIGKIAAASATTWLQGLLQPGPSTRTGNNKQSDSLVYNQSVAWLNAGIAGSGPRTVGDMVFAHSIMDAVTQQTFYPGIGPDLPCKTASIITCEKPETRYQDDTVYDMEASGFFSAASRFTTCELVHTCKIISDNQSSPVNTVSEKRITELVTDNMATIKTAIDSLQAINADVNCTNELPGEYDAIVTRWHFTKTQQHLLASLLNRWQIHNSQTFLQTIDASSLRSSKQLLQHLQIQVDNYPFVPASE